MSDVNDAPKFSKVGMVVGLGAVALAIAVIAYVSANSRSVELRASVTNKEQVAVGRRVYQDNCEACHGVQLKGLPTWHKTVQGDVSRAGTALNTVGDVWQASDNHIFQVISEGTRPIPEGAQPVIIHPEPFKGTLTEDEIWGVMAFIKTTWTVKQRVAQEETTQRELRAE